MIDLRQLDEYKMRRFSICESLAKEFLATKQRAKSYILNHCNPN